MLTSHSIVSHLFSPQTSLTAVMSFVLLHGLDALAVAAMIVEIKQSSVHCNLQCTFVKIASQLITCRGELTRRSLVFSIH